MGAIARVHREEERGREDDGREGSEFEMSLGCVYRKDNGKMSNTGRINKCYTALLRNDLSPALVGLVKG